MTGDRPTILFGVTIDPRVGGEAEAFARARLADEHGIDLISVMDHPYLPDLHETWTLITALAMRTERVHIHANVLNLALRQPAMLAKSAATLDVLSDGRFELAIGAGGLLEPIASFGGPTGTPADRYTAFKESLAIIRGLWEHAGDSFTHEGRFHRVKGAKFGPAPAHRIPIWTGAMGPRMVRLTGERADGILVSNPYVPAERLPDFNRWLDAGAARAGRPSSAIRRGYNMMGVLHTGTGPRLQPTRPNVLVGDAPVWIDTIEHLAREHRQDTFTFWPLAGNERAQVEAFAREVAPAVRERLG